MESYLPPREAILLAVAGLRSVLDANLHPLDLEQFDVRRCQVHRHWTWICHDTHLFQHPVLAICWSEHLPGHEDVDHVALCDVDAVDAVSDLLLDYGDVVVHCAVLVQPTSVCVFGFHHRLSVCFFFFVFFNRVLTLSL